MILNKNVLFAGFRVVDLVGNPFDYRETYEVEDQEGTKYFLTVYDNDKSQAMMKEGLVREFAFLRETPNPVFPDFIKAESCNYLGRQISFMLTRYFEGTSLRTVVEEKPLPENVAIDIALQVMMAMRDVIGYTNGGGHYNLCPDTILVSKAGERYEAHIIDFDHIAGPCMGETPFVTYNLNPCCRALETYLGRFNAASDVYSMGMLLGYMIKGKYPYWIDEYLLEREIRNIVRNWEKPELDLPEGLKQIVLRSINKNVRKRYMDLESMYHALNEYASKPHDVEENKVESNPVDIEEYEEQRETLESDVKTPHLAIDSNRKTGEGLRAVAGMDDLKRSLRCDFVDVIRNRHLAALFNIRPNNILLYGPQGCGKTYISNRLAEECGMEVYSVNPSDLGSIYIHGTQGIIRDLFNKAEEKAKKNGMGCLLLVDEIDAHLGKRDMEGREQQADEVAEWLVQLNDCVRKNVFVIGMTNRLDRLDKAAIRHGRFDKVFYVGLPDYACRKELLRMEVCKVPHAKHIDFDCLATMSEGFAAVDLAYAVKEAARLTFCACLKKHKNTLVVKEALLKEVIENTRPSVSSTELRNYERIWNAYINKKNTNQRQAIGFLA